jgi:hypothetical protein
MTAAPAAIRTTILTCANHFWRANGTGAGTPGDSDAVRAGVIVTIPTLRLVVQ